MAQIKILDCTLRDGGYINEWNFGIDKIKSIAGKEDLSINEVVNQSLQFAINDYEKNNNKGSK